jgi:hypothetical protein
MDWNQTELDVAVSFSLTASVGEEEWERCVSRELTQAIEKLTEKPLSAFWVRMFMQVLAEGMIKMVDDSMFLVAVNKGLNQECCAWRVAAIYPDLVVREGVKGGPFLLLMEPVGLEDLTAFGV